MAAAFQAAPVPEGPTSIHHARVSPERGSMFPQDAQPAWPGLAAPGLWRSGGGVGRVGGGPGRGGRTPGARGSAGADAAQGLTEMRAQERVEQRVQG